MLREAQITSTRTAHMHGHNVTEETARTDLMQLSKRGLLDRTKAGRRHVYTVPSDLAERLTTV
jgi:DeoR/GlpR family transcriptional regulator of sugar metabolism